MMNCEECLALRMLLENGLIGDDAEVVDKPDIISKGECIEVTSAIVDGINNRLSFGKLPKEKECIHMEDYFCNSCDLLKECKDRSEYGPVECKRCDNNPTWLKDGDTIILKGLVCYAHKEHPEALSLPESCEGNMSDLKNRIENKERKAMHYNCKNLGLFLYYDKRINDIPPIKSAIFKNIYIYCINDGELYKNWELVQCYINNGRPICYNKKCKKYGKFN